MVWGLYARPCCLPGLAAGGQRVRHHTVLFSIPDKIPQTVAEQISLSIPVSSPISLCRSSRIFEGKDKKFAQGGSFETGMIVLWGFPLSFPIRMEITGMIRHD